MERKEVIEILKVIGVTDKQAAEALKSAISDLELLEKVASGGVKKKEVYTQQNDGFGSVYTRKNEGAEIFNSAIDLCNAPFAGKMAGIKDVIDGFLRGTYAVQYTDQLTKEIITHLTAK